MGPPYPQVKVEDGPGTTVVTSRGYWEYLWEDLFAHCWGTCCDRHIFGVGSPIFAKTAGILMCRKNLGVQIIGAWT